MTDYEWKCPRQGFKYTPAKGCPFCKGNIIYIYDREDYYLAGHQEGCLFFGREMLFNSFDEMERLWENRV